MAVQKFSSNSEENIHEYEFQKDPELHPETA